MCTHINESLLQKKLIVNIENDFAERRKKAMSENGQTKISGIPAISAIYYALLQCGYDFFSMERGN